MLRELILVPRILYSGLFVIMGMFTAFTSPSGPILFIGSFLFIFVLSFVWQYVEGRFRFYTSRNTLALNTRFANNSPANKFGLFRVD